MENKPIINMNWDNKTKLDNIRVVSYVDFLNKLVAINIDFTKVKINGLYYFKNTQKNIFPKSFTNKWILLKLYRCFPSSKSELGEIWKPLTGGEPTKFTADYWFEVLKVRETEEEIKSNSYLHGFRHVIDDNRYFSAIPLVNELTHWDNGIISNSKVSVDFILGENPNLWDKFKITHKTETDYTFEIRKMLLEHHENPER